MVNHLEDDHEILKEILWEAARNNGLITEIGYITEALTLIRNGSDYIFQVLKNVSSGKHTYDPVFVERCCCYLFGKGIEAVIKWGHTDEGKFSVYYDHLHLIDMNLNAEVPKEYSTLVQGGSKFGSVLFQAHMDWCENRILKNYVQIDLAGEVKCLFRQCSLFGMSYALERKLQGNKPFHKQKV